MRVAVFGNFGVKNIGDDMILMGFLSKHEEDEVIVFSGNPKQVRGQFGRKAYPFFPGGVRSFFRFFFSSAYRQELKEAWSELKSADRIFIGGGGILVDRHLKALVLWWRQLKAISRTGKPYEFIANSFELKHWWSCRLFSKYLREADKISVRDRGSLSFIESLGLKAELVEDLSPTPGLRSRRGNASTAKKIALALCRWGIGAEQKKALQNFIEDKKKEGYQFVGLAFQSEGDDDRKIFNSIDPSITVMTELKEILNELSSSEILIGMRFHAVLLALNLDIPVVALAYQDKVTNLMKDKGMTKSCLPVSELNDNNLREVFSLCLSSEENPVHA